MTYHDWHTEYMDTYKRGLKPRTRAEYDRLHQRYIAPLIGAAELEELSPEDLQRVLNAAAGTGARTAQAVFALLRAVLRRAVRSRRLLWSPLDALDRPQHMPTPGQAMTDEDYAAALPPISEDVGLSLALLAGLRRGEVAGLQWGDVDLHARLIHVRRTRLRLSGRLLVQPPKSAAGVRAVPICTELLPILRAAYVLRPAAWVISTAPEALDRHWRRIQDQDVQLSRHYRLHDLRHTYVSRLLLAGAVPRVVQYVAGHADMATTLRVYAHVTATDARRELDRIASLTAQQKGYLTLNQGVPGSSP